MLPHDKFHMKVRVAPIKIPIENVPKAITFKASHHE